MESPTLTPQSPLDGYDGFDMSAYEPDESIPCKGCNRVSCFVVALPDPRRVSSLFSALEATMAISEEKRRGGLSECF